MSGGLVLGVKIIFLTLFYFAGWLWGWRLAQESDSKNVKDFPFVGGLAVAFLTAVFTAETSAVWAIPFLFALTASVASDLRAMVVSDRALILAVVGWVLWQFFEHNPLPGLIGGVTGLGAGFLLDWLALKVYRTSGFGDGDSGILGVAGLYLGLKGWWLMLTTGSIAGLFYVAVLYLLRRLQRNQLVPFVPFLYVGALVALADNVGFLKIFF